jgi:glycosyltransferase involved in cell wall biosynthesis
MAQNGFDETAPGKAGAAGAAIQPASGLIVFGEDWGAHPSSTQHLAACLAAGRRVLWVNSIGLRRPRLTAADASRAARKVARALLSRCFRKPSRESRAPFPTVQPLVVPMARWRPLRALNRALLTRSVGRAADAAGLERPVLWISLPSAVDAVGALGESAVVYYCCDDFGSLAGVDHPAALAMEAELAERADLILAASPALAARFPSGKTLLLPHGVDLELFSRPAPRAGDLPEGGPVAGYYGTIAPWLDLGLVAAVARLLPEWRFAMIGAVQTDVSAVAGLANVHFLGPRPHADLPRYSQHWDAGIIPFLDTPQIRACNPLKLREYLAAGKPVVATPFPALAPYAAGVRTAAGAAGIAAALRASLTDGPREADARRALVAADSWAARAAEASAAISALPCRR